MQKSRANLQTQLQSYSVASKGLRASKNWKRGGSALATVAGSALALATNADASIIYSGIQNISAVRPGPAGVGGVQATFSIGGVPWGVYAFNNIGSRLSTAFARLKLFAGNGESVMASSHFSPKARRLASGAAISSGQTFIKPSEPWLRRKNLASFTGQFLTSVNGFAGIQFNQGGAQHFGWIRLHVSIGPGNAVTTTAIDWAYNDVARESITAGEGIPAAAPEPATASMALLAAGAAGVLAWRKRRTQIAA